MTRVLWILAIITITCGCAVKRSKPQRPEIVSAKYLRVDSVSIELSYRDLISCIDDQPAEMLSIQVYRGRSVLFLGGEYSKKVGPFDGSVMDMVISFESKAKTSSGCGGFEGGHGMLIRMVVNGDESEFGYCKDDWDGIGELIAAIEERARN